MSSRIDDLPDLIEQAMAGGYKGIVWDGKGKKDKRLEDMNFDELTDHYTDQIASGKASLA